MSTWSKNFTQIENVNGGYEVELNDVPTPQMFNVALNNTQYLYDLLQTGFIKSITASASGLTIVVRGVNKQETTVVISQSDLDMYKKGEVDNAIANMVKFSAQNLTDAQKTQARANIGAGDGNYNNLTNKPELRTVATSGLYRDLTSRMRAHYISITLKANQSTASQSASAYIREGRIGDRVFFTLVNTTQFSYANNDSRALFTSIVEAGGLVSATGFVQDGNGNNYPIMYVNKISSYLECVAIDGRKFSIYEEPASVYSTNNGYQVTDTVV